MARQIKLITFIDLIFLLLLIVSGSIENAIVSDTVYYLAFVIPISVGLTYVFTQRAGAGVSVMDSAKSTLKDFTIGWDKAILSLPVIAIGIASVIFISMATTEIMELFGKENQSTFDEPFLLALLIHALIPAVLEELLFRFVPINLLRGEPKTAILISSVAFAAAHANLFQIPHALIAGFFLAFLYVITKSILPCIVMHLLNNALSLASIYGYISPAALAVTALALSAFLIFIFTGRGAYKKAVVDIINSKKTAIGYSPLVFIAISLFLAISSLFA